MPHFNKYGEAQYSAQELFDILYQNPELDLSKFTAIDDALEFIQSNHELHTGLPEPKFPDPTFYETVADFDAARQANWYMPQVYKDMDIAQWLLNVCRTDAALQRVGEELLLYQDRNLFDLLRFLKYLVDTMRKNNIVWGVGRGSSVASYVLYLIGVHKIDSMYYDLDIHEFLR